MCLDGIVGLEGSGGPYSRARRLLFDFTILQVCCYRDEWC
jgi:hypothetical protein